MTEARRVESKILQELIQGKYETLKTGKNPRFREFAEEYKKLIKWQKSYKKTLSKIIKLYVFRGLKREKLNSIRKPLERTFVESGVEPRPFHTFRHFWTKMMFEAGVDPATIQKIGRWRDFQTMLRYFYTTRPQEHEAVNKLSTQLSKKKPTILKMRQYSGNDKKLS
jgi:integrase